VLELFGVAGAGLVGAIPGGLFELTFGIWLIARGFASTATVPSREDRRRTGLGVEPGDLLNACDRRAVAEGAVGAPLVVVAHPVWQ
jgi:hypothetical protein